MCSDHKSSNAVSFSLGAVLGAGAGVFLSTKKGKRLLKQAWKQIEPYIGDMDSVDRTISQVKDLNKKIPANIKAPLKRTFFKGV